MTDIVAAAKTRIAELETELGELREFVATAERLAARLIQATPTAVASGRTSSAMADTEAATEAALNASGAPLHIKALYEALIQQGLEIGGKNPTSTLSARLHNSGKFKSHSGLGWWFKDRPLPPRFLGGQAVETSPSVSSPIDDDAPSNSTIQGGTSHGTALDR